MRDSELLLTLQPVWLERAILTLAPGSLFREDLRPQLQHFFELLCQVVETGTPQWLDPIIDEWTVSLTRSDLEGSVSSISEFINELMQITISAVQETFAEGQALTLLRALLPHFGYAFQKTAQIETQAKFDFLSNALAKTRQDLEQIEHTKSDFVAVAAHELKTPLTLIAGYAAMLRESLDQVGLSAYQASLLEGIQHGADRLHAIINDMIDTSLIDNQLLTLNFQPLWIGQLLSILETELAPILQDRHQKLTISRIAAMSEMTFGDPERLLQVFRNVLSNAVKFTPDGGEILITGRKLPGFVEVTIADTGIGIDPENLNVIFEKFVRLGSVSLHSSGKTKFKGGGPGLGLSIARGILENHGGTIWVESPGYDEQVCPGSTFHILIPLRSEPPDLRMARLFAPFIDNKNPKEKANPK